MFHADTEPVIDFYKGLGKVANVSLSQTIICRDSTLMTSYTRSMHQVESMTCTWRHRLKSRSSFQRKRRRHHDVLNLPNPNVVSYTIKLSLSFKKVLALTLPSVVTDEMRVKQTGSSDSTKREGLCAFPSSMPLSL